MMAKHSWQKRWGVPLALVVGIALLALWPFLSRDSLPVETDAELHVFRLAELSYLVRGGEFYPRWAPNFYHGYGYPIFNYYAPLTYYLGLPVELLPGLDAVDGIKAVFVLGLLLGGIGTFGYVRRQWGAAAGYVATAVYLYAPYVLYVDPHARGALAESFSLGIFPLALWLLDRLRGRQTPGRLAAAALAVAGVILSHNLMALLFFGILAAWAAWQWLVAAAGGRRAAAWPIAALGLGLLLAAFFWLPVALERTAVNLNTLLGRGDNYDFRTHFLTLRELLAWTPRLDWGDTQPAFRFNLGVAQWLLGGLGLLLLAVRRLRRARQAAFFAIGLLLLLALMLPLSTAVWEALPFLPYFQFPWRLLGAAAFCLAVLAGAAVDALLARGPTAGRTAVAVGVALPILLGLPLTQPAPWDDFGPVTQRRLTEIEHRGRWLGTTSTADYVPATVDVVPPPTPDVVRGYYEGTPVDRVNRVAMPDGAVVEAERIRPLLTRYHVQAPKNFRLRLYLFDFPGWQVRIDGERVETELARPEGFIVVPV
ncbi:MAG: hypothetical protein KC425_22730, partial [Anaerolineales bacterium]|nr:hypothetical protein [Anaerolineales bacterium]